MSAVPSSDVDFFKGHLADTERVLWAGQPVRLAYVFAALPMMVFGAFWLVLPAGMWWVLTDMQETSLTMAFRIFLAPFFAVGLWMVATPLLATKRAHLVHYAVTDQRVLIKEDFGSHRLIAIRLDQVRAVDVTRNRVENFCNVGTVEIDVGEQVRRGAPFRQFRFVGVPGAGEAVRAISTTSYMARGFR